MVAKETFGLSLSERVGEERKAANSFQGKALGVCECQMVLGKEGPGRWLEGAGPWIMWTPNLLFDTTASVR